MKYLIQTRIGKRFLWTFLLLALPIVIADWMGERMTTQAMRQQTQAMLRVASDGAEAQVLEFLQSLRRSTEARAVEDEIRDLLVPPLGKQADLSDALKKLQTRTPEALEIICVSLEGRVMGSSSAELRGADASSWWEFQRGRESFYPGAIIRNPRNGMAQWRMSAPIRDMRTGKLLGVVLVGFDPGALSALTTGKRVLSQGAGTQSFRMGASGETYIVNTNGILLTELRFAPGSVLSRKLNTAPIRAAIENGEEIRAVYKDYRGVEVTGVSAILSDMGWVLITEIDFRQAFAATRALRKLLTGITVLILATAALIAGRFARQIVQPLVRTSEADRALSAGDEAHAVVPEQGLPSDEIGDFIRQRNANVRALFEHERKLLREQEQRAETAAALEGISYSMVHDMRAPLRTIVTLGDVINEEAGEQLKPEEKQHLARIKRACLRMDQLICDLMKYSTLLRAEVPLAAVNPQELLRQVIEKNPAFKSRIIDIQNGMPVVLANAALLEQCFFVLLDNAVRYAKPDVPVKIRIWPENDGVETKIYVEDNGTGMSKIFQRRLFGIFERGTNMPGGSGIGLALLRVAVERMGGTVGVDSEEVKGSRFWIKLQRAGQAGESRNV